MSLTIQNLLKAKRFGESLQGTRPLQYRLKDWQGLVHGKERAVRLIAKSLLGVPTAYHSDQDHPVWTFAFADDGTLAVYVNKGNNHVYLAAGNEENSRDVQAAADFLLSEFATRLKQL